MKSVTTRDANGSHDAAILEVLQKSKAHAVQRGDQEGAKVIWCYEQILKTQTHYINAFQSIKTEAYYEAWRLLERIENKLRMLRMHFAPFNDDFKLKFIEKSTRQLQSLYPYKLFGSPGFIVHEKECSICRKRISIRDRCEHKPGEIYDGELCCGVVTKWEPVEISIVKNPVQKFSVIFLSDPKTGEQIDQYNYDLLAYAVSLVDRPFEYWDLHWTKIRHPHSRFLEVKGDDDCPCESGKTYGACCFLKPGVLRPHCEIKLHKPPSRSMPKIQYF